MSNYSMILTKVGLAKVTNAQLTNENVLITHFVVGDGDGANYVPTQEMVALKNEKWRGAVSSVEIDKDNPHWIVVTGAIPAKDGGFMIREAGLIDKDGDLVAIGNTPETYKPLQTEGAAKDLILKQYIEVSNATNVTLQIDPTVIIASRDYVDKKVGKTEMEVIEVRADFVNLRKQLDTEFEEVIEQSTQTKRKLQTQGMTINNYNPFLGGAVVFYTDDGHREDYTIFKDVFAVHNVPCCTGVISSQIGVGQKATLAQLLELQNVYGWEISSHSKTHPQIAQATDEQAEDELIGSYESLNALGLKVDTFAYPYGSISSRDKRIARQVYKAARQSKNGPYGYNKTPLASQSLYSVWIGSDSGGGKPIDGYSVNTFEYYKNLIDKANADNGLLIISFHSWAYTQSDPILQVFKDVVAYAVANTNVMRLSDAIDVYGNVIDVGDTNADELSYEDHFAVSAYGGASSNRLKTKHSPRDCYNGLSTVTDFDAFTTTINDVSTSAAREGGLPVDAGGTLITYRHADRNVSLLYDFQIYLPLNRSTFFKRQSDTNGDWRDWEDLSNYIYYKPDNTFTENINDYKLGITFTNINKATALTHDLPLNETTGGVLKTFKTHNTTALYVHQEYTVLNVGRVYRRNIKTDGTWSAWAESTGYITFGGNADAIKSISDFVIGVTHSKIDNATASTNGLPSGVGGLLTTIKLDNVELGFVRQTYKPYAQNVTYERGFATNGTPTNWAVSGGRLIGTTSQRPTTHLYDGLEYKDTTLKKTVTYYSGSWYDETSAIV